MSRFTNLCKAVNTRQSCRGLGGKTIATNITKELFAKEGISFEGWEVTEIPMVNNHITEAELYYPKSAVICIANRAMRKSVVIVIEKSCIMVEVGAGERGILMPTIAAAINSHYSNY